MVITSRVETGKRTYVFLDKKGAPVIPDHLREVIWRPALLEAEIEYRPMLQTRHTFATMMLDSPEDIGWIQNQLGHASLQMIYTRYYSWIKNTTRNGGSAFIKNMYEKAFDTGEKVEKNTGNFKKPAVKLINFTPNLHQHKKRVSSN